MIRTVHETLEPDEISLPFKCLGPELKDQRRSKEIKDENQKYLEPMELS